MNSIQLSLLPNEWSPLDETIGKIRTFGTRHHNYVRFVRLVATSAMGQRRGSVILCAALSDYDASEMCADIKRLVQETLDKCDDSSSGVCTVDTPHALRSGEMRAAIVEAYHQAGELFYACHRSGPKFQLDGTFAYVGQNHAQRIATLIKNREPAFYLFKNIHLLQRIDGQPSEAMEFVRMLGQVAAISERTHILLGNARTVLRWMKAPEIADMVVPVALAPYDLQEAAERNDFLSVLAGYDLELPWEKDASLVDHGEYVHGAVGGSPHRLRKWILNALCLARSHAQSELTWACFESSAPTKAEIDQAAQELKLASEFLGKPLKQAGPPPIPPNHSRTPGTRNLGRDAYAA